MSISCLIVDDNEYFLHAAQVLLEREGLVVMGVTSTSDEAVRQVETLHPDVVLVDIFRRRPQFETLLKLTGASA